MRGCSCRLGCDGLSGYLIVDAALFRVLQNVVRLVELLELGLVAACAEKRRGRVTTQFECGRSSRVWQGLDRSHQERAFVAVLYPAATPVHECQRGKLAAACIINAAAGGRSGARLYNDPVRCAYATVSTQQDASHPVMFAAPLHELF